MNREDFLLQLNEVAADLQQPLSIIRQLSLATKQNTDAARQEHQQKIQLTAEYAMRLAANLALMRSNMEQLFPLETVNIQQVCQASVELVRPYARQRGATVHIRRKRPVPLVVANRDLLQRLMASLIDAQIAGGAQQVFLELHQRGGQGVQVSVRSNVIDTTLYGGAGNLVAREFCGAMQLSLRQVRHRTGERSTLIEAPVSQQLPLVG